MFCVVITAKGLEKYRKSSNENVICDVLCFYLPTSSFRSEIFVLGAFNVLSALDQPHHKLLKTNHHARRQRWEGRGQKKSFLRLSASLRGELPFLMLSIALVPQTNP